MIKTLTLFDMGRHDGHDVPPQTLLITVLSCLGGGRCNLVTSNISMEHQKSYFWFTKLSGVTIATSLSGSTRDFLKLLFHIFAYNEISKVFKSKI